MCSKILKTSGNTSNLMCHVKQKHSKIYNKSGSSAGVSDVTEVVTETPCKKAKSNKVIDNQSEIMRSCSLASTITIESSPNRKSPPHFETTSPSIVGEPNTTRQ
ncbi:unnamed protein product, partial [Tenebrio molitor]